MRKILTIALVALMAASLFAGVKTSGYVQGTVHADFDEKIADGTKSADPVLNAADGDNKAQINITDENKVWGTTITVQNTKAFGLMSKTWLDIMKVANAEGDFSVKATFITFDKIAALTAYTNNADEVNVQRVRTEADGHGVNFDFGYGKYVKAQAGIQMYEGAITEDNRDSEKHGMTLVASVLGTPVDGVKVSAGVKMYDMKMDAKGKNYGIAVKDAEKYYTKSSAYTVAAEVDIAKLADLDFSLAGGVAYTNYACDDDGRLVAQVFGEYEGISGYAELGFLDVEDYMKLGCAYAIADNADVGAYITLFDYTDIKFDENVTLGVEGNYALNKAVSFYGNIEKSNAFGTTSGKYFSTIDVEARMKIKF